MTVSVAALRKSYEFRGRRREPVAALDALDLEVQPGELLVVVGPSGSGKTTLLRCIAGLEDPDSGTISVAGRDVTGMAPGARDVAMVFQEYALYPHMTVEANISFGLRARRVEARAASELARTAAEHLGIDSTLDRMPGELSGGERQRVALARAMVREPAVFLMDEPLSNLDAELRAQTRAEIRSLQQRLGTTTVYVTHDQTEAMTMADRVAVLRAGRVEQVATPVEIYERPANGFVARFFGSPPMNVFPSSIHPGPHSDSWLGIRPEKIKLRPSGDGDVTGRVEAVEPLGAEAIVHVVVDGARLLVRELLESSPAVGTNVGLELHGSDLYEFETRDGPRVP